ncbi:MAG: hypothetical protein V4547_16530 [Bacteroidota bacterium]
MSPKNQQAPMKVVKDQPTKEAPAQEQRPIDLINVYQIKVKVTCPADKKFTFAEGIVLATDLEKAKQAVINASQHSHPGHEVLFCKTTMLKADFLLQFQDDQPKPAAKKAAAPAPPAAQKPAVKKEGAQPAKKPFNVTKPKRVNPKK